MHQEHLRSATDVGVNRHGEHGVVELSVDPVELIAPHLFDVARVHKAMTIRRFFDEHHRRQIIEIPVGGDLDEVRLFPTHQRSHPLRRRPRVVDFRPAIANTDIVRMEVVMHEAVVVAKAMFQQQLIRDVGELPPRRHIAGRPLS